MRRIGSVAFIAVSLVAVLYFGAGAVILRYGLDRILWRRLSTSEPLPSPTYALLADGTRSIVRAVGSETARCVVFFPGQSGGFLRYAHDLFPPLNSAGLQVWAISYPGQNRAVGEAKRTTVLSEIQSLLGSISAHCPREHTVFVGRSLGVGVAAIAAAEWRPRGLVLDGAGLSLAAAVRHELAHRWYKRVLELPPVEALISPDYHLAVSVSDFGPSHTIIFQG